MTPDECNGACTDTDSDGRNCGACGHDCLGGQCMAGRCQPVEVTQGLSNPTALALHTDGYLYFVEERAGGGVSRVLAMGGAAAQLLIGMQNKPGAIAVDDDGVFFVNKGGNQVRKIAFDGSGGVLADYGSGDVVPYGIAIDPMFVYWVDQVSGKVRRKPKGNIGAIDDVATGEIGPAAVAVDRIIDECPYWVNQGQTGQSNGAVRHLGVGGVPADLSTGEAEPVALAIDPDSSCTPTGSVYYVDSANGEVKKVPKAGPGPGQILAMGQSNPSAIAVDDSYVYWANRVANGGVYRIKKDGSETTPTPVAEGLDYPAGLALDGEQIYLTESANATAQSGRILRVRKPR